MCPQGPAPQLRGFCAQIAKGTPGTSRRALRRVLARGYLLFVGVWGTNALPHPSLVPLLSSLTGDLQNNPPGSAQVSPEAGQTPSWHPAGFASPARAHGAAQPQPCSLKSSPIYHFSSLKLSLLLQAPPGPIQPSVPGQSLTQHPEPRVGRDRLLPLFWEQ